MSDRHKFNSDFYNITLKSVLKKELFSFFGRLFLEKKIKTSKKYLQLGCGSSEENLSDDFINCDFFNLNFFKFYKKKKIQYLDLRYKLPFASDIFRGVYSEHTIKHLYPTEVLRLFKEIYRVLKKNGIFRVVVPDLKKYIYYYNGKKDVFPDNQFKFGCEAIWNIAQNYEHKSLWDEEWLKFHLKNCNFHKIKRCKYQVSQDKNLILDKKGREIESIYLEATK